MMKTKLSLIVVGLLLSMPLLFAQKTFPNNGPADKRDDAFAFFNATIFKNFNEKIENATLVIRNGKIENIGKNITIPKDAVAVDLKGKMIYPSFIDLFSDYGMPAVPERTSAPTRTTTLLTTKKGAFAWNEALKTEFRGSENFLVNSSNAKDFRAAGFGTSLSHRIDGISRGAAVLVLLSEEREHEVILKDKAAHVFSFNKGTSAQDYPSSLMGGIALLRQTYYDAQWYKTEGSKQEKNLSLEAWNDLIVGLPQIFAVGDKLEALRAAKLGKEFNQNYIIKTNGDEYQRIDAIKANGNPLIVPLKFAEAYDVEDPYDAMNIDIAQLKHWELAPSNAGKLAKAGIQFSLTSFGLKNKSDFLTALRKAVENGLSETDALKALTETPAKLVGASDIIGTLDVGKIANFFISDKNIFEKEAKIYQNWVKGKNNAILDLNTPNLNGNYDLTIGDKNYKMSVEGNPEKPDMFFYKDTVKTKIDYTLGNASISFSLNPTNDKGNLIRLSGVISETKWRGRTQLPDGSWTSWLANFTSVAAPTEIKKTDKKVENTEVGDITYPFAAFGNKEIPKQGVFLIKNATVWTNEKEGILKNTDVLIQNGKIAQVGKSLKGIAGATEIDGTGKHLTAGIIDEHSHIALSRGVNEGTQESSAEVRIGDVIDSEDVDIYRQLAGGVVASQLLHGSANPIGGQSQLIKLRWGYEPEKMKFEGADGFIKFALGENVKQSNWANNGVRYPQTRMGVEQVYDDYFTRAKEYGVLKASGKTYRKDLDLDAILEILNKKRFITCHSYVQSEINMLMKVAEKHNFRVNTFTHILEGYKVADKMAAHGVGGSTFSDWWSYKFETYHAIPYNAAIMYEQGVVVAINSDDAEMARRLNQEAGKTVEFGNVPEEEAWKFVTLNPAKLLHVDNRTGSIKVGKDADIVLWSDNPLSVYAKSEYTFVDGIKFFDRKDYEKVEEMNQKEKSRLIQKMIAAKKSGEPTKAAKGKGKSHYHCDSDADEMAK